MQRLHPLVLLPIAVAAGGCASQATMDARYDASLGRWQGATRAELEATWGRPTLVQVGAEASVLTWIVRNDALDGRAGALGSPVVVVNRAADGSISGATLRPGASVPASVPITCTTQFTMKDGKVASWRFEGLGCGAPD
jgi:hypothetical protein